MNHLPALPGLTFRCCLIMAYTGWFTKSGKWTLGPVLGIIAASTTYRPRPSQDEALHSREGILTGSAQVAPPGANAWCIIARAMTCGKG